MISGYLIDRIALNSCKSLFGAIVIYKDKYCQINQIVIYYFHRSLFRKIDILRNSLGNFHWKTLPQAFSIASQHICGKLGFTAIFCSTNDDFIYRRF